MNRYVELQYLGEGTFGSVTLRRCLDSGELVAVKKMKRKFYSWEECLNLREVKSLKTLKHANVIMLKEVIRENDELYFVFEYMKENLYQLMKERTHMFPESEVRNIMYQILQGLAFIHKHGFFHRDMKPENILCMGPDLVKIADFGLAREIRSCPPYTGYVSTRWYRAPEVLLNSTRYSSPIDHWAIGCIMAELYKLRPLFPGSSEVDTILKICHVLGTPKQSDWPEGCLLAATMGFRWPRCVPMNLASLIPNASSEAIQLMRDLLQWDPIKRPAACQALRYPYFHVGQVLGAPQQIQDQGKTQPPQLRPNPSPQIPTLPLPDTTYQPQHRPEPPKRPGKTEVRTDRAVRNRFPQIHDKGLQSKPKGGRRRWGNVAGVLKCEDCDDSDDADSTNTTPKKLFFTSNEKQLQGDSSVNRQGNALDLGLSNVRKDEAMERNINKALPFQESSRTAFAKQHYLKQSRYLTGLRIKKNVAVNAAKDYSGNLWEGSRVPVGGTHVGGYAPSANKKETDSASQKVHLTPVESTMLNYAMWISSRSNTHIGTSPYVPYPNTSTHGMPSQPSVQPVHGRTDWTAKYGRR
ncbi:serine/threonine-protein kinase ICK-like isoform X1 [Tachysurus vachellii]|uniref:serine/threonine-protein kinase ICK-like isoform X1 n=1 Tax=Tachysurus vachellii TaxID=175792 RepID=UPI00296B0254|nr:serine/threonine-protein kinase ICK-like isoform X1 [Tachysurus vachellii]